MAVDRATVLRQQQLFDQAMQAAGNNPVEAERLSRIAMMQSGLEYMYRKQQEEIEKGGREAEMALREGRIAMRAKDAAQRASLAREALREGQKIRNIGLALNVASTLGASAIPVIHEKMKAPKEAEKAIPVEKAMPVRKTPEERAAFMETLKASRDDAATSGFVGPPAPPDLSTARGVDPTQAIQRDRAQQDSAAGFRTLDAYSEDADQLNNALGVIGDQRGEEAMRMVRDILEQSPQGPLPGQRSDRSMDDKIWRLINNNMGVA